MPIIFITGYGDVPMTVRAMKAGAVEFLTKPFGDDVLLSAIRHAIERSCAALGHEAEMRALRDCYASLSRREREVMALVVSGLLNKQVGGELGISEITVKAHRGKVMRKMKADSLADLVNMAARLASRPRRKAATAPPGGGPSPGARTRLPTLASRGAPHGAAPPGGLGTAPGQKARGLLARPPEGKGLPHGGVSRAGGCGGAARRPHPAKRRTCCVHAGGLGDPPLHPTGFEGIVDTIVQ